MLGLVEYGPVDYDLGPLIRWAKALPEGLWKYRPDRESFTTKVVRENVPHFPKKEAEALIDAAQKQHLGPGVFNRMVVANVPVGAYILPHTDDFGADIRSRSVHCHIPLSTDPEAIMGFDDGEVHLRAGFLYTMDETKTHYVKNPGRADRIHLLFAHFHNGGLNAPS